IVVNFLAAKFFAMAGDHKSDINAKGAYVHLMADAGVSLGVVVAGLLTMLTKWFWLDPVVSIIIGIVIIVSSRSEEHTSELQSRFVLVCRLLLEKKNMHRSQH